MLKTQLNKLILFVFSFIITNINAQTNVATNSDCTNAIEIQLRKSIIYKSKSPPVGYGKVMEIKSNGNADNKAFDEEHNTAWFILNIEYNGEIVFDIIPDEYSNDYDFLLYHYDNTFCSSFTEKSPSPIRSNLARNDISNNGKTGLSHGAKDNFIGKGVKTNYSHSLQVEKNEKYILVLDNLSPNGKGFKIDFGFVNPILITGKVNDFIKNPLAAEIALIDEHNKKIASATTDPKTGNYSLNVVIRDNEFYSINFYNKAYLPDVAYVNTRLLGSTGNTLIFNKTLTGLKVGETYNLATYKFKDQGFLLYEEWTPLYLIQTLMNKNPNMKVKIETHADEAEDKWWNNNGTSASNLQSLRESYWQKNVGSKKLAYSCPDKLKYSFADWRAITIIGAMQNLNISTDRILFAPSDKLIFSNPQTEEEHKKNRVITITILSND